MGSLLETRNIKCVETSNHFTWTLMSQPMRDHHTGFWSWMIWDLLSIWIKYDGCHFEICCPPAVDHVLTSSSGLLRAAVVPSRLVSMWQYCVQVFPILYGQIYRSNISSQTHLNMGVCAWSPTPIKYCWNIIHHIKINKVNQLKTIYSYLLSITI